METFGPTIQGEGNMIGVKTSFIRFGGCDFRCRACDSMFAVDPKSVHAKAKWFSLDQIYTAIEDVTVPTNTHWITLSGGNPAIWDLADLPLRLYVDAEISCAVETQGTIWHDWINNCRQVTISPKGPGMGEKCDKTMLTRFISKLYTRAHFRHNAPYGGVSVKIVVFSAADLEFAQGIDELLNALEFPNDQRFLSVGNPFPPDILSALTLEQLPLARLLLDEYRASLEMDFLPHRGLSHWRYLPQLHVLLYGNKQGV